MRIAENEKWITLFWWTLLKVVLLQSFQSPFTIHMYPRLLQWEKYGQFPSDG